MEDECIGIRDSEEFLDKQTVVHTKDGKYFFGKFRSFDQFQNITLENTVERIFCDDIYCEKRVGLYVIRGESVVFFGITNEDLSNYKKVSEESVLKKLENISLLV